MSMHQKIEAPAGDVIGAFPAQYDTDALPDRRASAFARLITILAIVEAFAIAALSFAIATLVPLQKIVPMVVAASSKGDEIVRVNPVTLDSPTSDYLTEKALRDYVLKRYAIVANSAEQASYWAPGSTVQLMSTPEAYSSFATTSKTEWERLRSAKMTRSVRIDSVRKIGDFVWQVEYATTEKPDEDAFQPAAGGVTQGWVSTFTVTFEPKNVKYSDRLNNPLGMTITEASDARRD